MPRKKSLRSPPEKRVGPDRQDPVCPVDIAFLFPRTKIIRRPNSSLSRAKTRSACVRALYRRARSGSIGIFSPLRGVRSMTGPSPSPRTSVRRERHHRRHPPDSIPEPPAPSSREERGGLALVKLSRGQKTGGGTPSPHDRGMERVVLPDLVFSLTVRLGPPRTVPGEGSASSRTVSSEGCGSLWSVREEKPFLLLFIFTATDFRELWAFSPGGDGGGVQGSKITTIFRGSSVRGPRQSSIRRNRDL